MKGTVASLFQAAKESPVVEGLVAARDTLRAVSDSRGAAPLHAMVRQGADELAQVLAAFPDSNVKPVSEVGQLFEPTQAIVTGQLTGNTVESLFGKNRQQDQQERNRSMDGRDI